MSVIPPRATVATTVSGDVSTDGLHAETHINRQLSRFLREGARETARGASWLFAGVPLTQESSPAFGVSAEDDQGCSSTRVFANKNAKQLESGTASHTPDPRDGAKYLCCHVPPHFVLRLLWSMAHLKTIAIRQHLWKEICSRKDTQSCSSRRNWDYMKAKITWV